MIPRLYDGGAETLVKDYAIKLDKQIIDVSVLTINKVADTANTKRLEQYGTKIMSLYPKWTLVHRVFNRLFAKWYIPFAIKKIIKKEKPDVIHVHLTMLKYLALISKDLQNIRLFYTCHNEANRMFCGARAKEGKAAALLIKNNHLQLIALHEDMKKDINRIFDIDNTMIIRNGVDFDKFRNVKELKSDIRRDIGIPDDAFVLGHIGRFQKQKNHEYLIDVFSEVSKLSDNVWLLMIGTGELQEDVEQRLIRYGLRNKAVILSHRTDIPQLLKAMDVFVFPSQFEGLSVTLVEAQVSGLRCIVSDTINEANYMLDTTIPVSISKKPCEWADIILNDMVHGKALNNIDLYDMNLEIKRIEKMYTGNGENDGALKN